MRGLTPAEYEELAAKVARTDAGAPLHRIAHGSPEHALKLELQAQGRVWYGPPELPNTRGTWRITEQGRLAVRLWPTVAAFFAPSGAPKESP